MIASCRIPRRQSYRSPHESRRARNGRNQRPHRLDRSGRRDGQGRQRDLDRQGVHRRRLRHGAGPRRRRRREGRRPTPGAPPPAASASSSRSTSFPRPARRSRSESANARGGRKACRPSAAAAARPDRDLASIAEARALARRAKHARLDLAEFSQEQIDAIVDAMAAAVTPQAEALARLAVEETGYGVVADKIQKNLFASQTGLQVHPADEDGRRHRRLEDRKVIEIAEPFGVVAAIVPTTNPTSTAIYKILIAIKARCPIVISPHPSAVRCITRVAEIMNEAARARGRARRRDQLDDDRHARGHAGVDEAARGRRHPGDGRHGARPRRVQRRQAGLWRRSRQRARVHRTIGRRHEGRPRHHHRQDVRQRRPLLVAENSVVVDAADRRGREARVRDAGRVLPDAAEIEAVAPGCWSRRSACPIPRWSARPATCIAEKGRHHGAAGDARAHRAADGRRSRLPAVDRKAVPRAVVLRRGGLARRLRALQGDPAVRRHRESERPPQCGQRK